MKILFAVTGGVCTCAKCKAQKQERRLSVRVVPAQFKDEENISALKNYAVTTGEYIIMY